jgi:hypothetical protein
MEPERVVGAGSKPGSETLTGRGPRNRAERR